MDVGGTDMSGDEQVPLHKAMLYERLPEGRAKCAVCQRRCVIAEDKVGTCMTRVPAGSG